MVSQVCSPPPNIPKDNESNQIIKRGRAINRASITSFAVPTQAVPRLSAPPVHTPGTPEGKSRYKMSHE